MAREGGFLSIFSENFFFKEGSWAFCYHGWMVGWGYDVFVPCGFFFFSCHGYVSKGTFLLLDILNGKTLVCE